MSSILLDVPYYSQLDNVSEPHRSCNKSSCCMVAEFMKPGVFRNSDDVYSILLEGYGDTTNHDAHTRLLGTRNIESEFRYDLSYKALDESLYDRKLPVVIAVLHKGYYLTPYGGHCLVVVGKTDDDNYIVNDPWGEPFHYQRTDGFRKKVPKQSLDTRWLVEGDSSGWGRLFYW